MSKESITFNGSTQKIISLRPTNDTFIIKAKKVIIKDTELGIEIDLQDKVNQFNKIIVDGITFVKVERKWNTLERKMEYKDTTIFVN